MNTIEQHMAELLTV